MTYLCPKTERYSEILKAFKAYLKNKGYSPNTQQMLPTCAAEFLYRMEQQSVDHIKWIEPVHIQEHYQYLCKRPNLRKEGGLSASMLGHHIYALRTFFAWLQQLDAIDLNPLSGMDFNKTDRPRRMAVPEESIMAMFQACDNKHDRAILSLYYGCGLRRSEGAALNRSDIDFEEARLIVRSGKYDKRREVPLQENIVNYLKDYWLYERPGYATRYDSDNRKAFLVNKIGNRMSGDSANERVKALAEKAKVGQAVTLHVLRHSIATHLKQHGMPMERIQEFLGHSTLDVTQAYIEGYRPRWRKRYFDRS